MKSDRTLPYQIGPQRKAIILFGPSLLIGLYVLYGYYHPTQTWQAHEKLLHHGYAWFFLAWSIVSVAMIANTLVTSTIFSASEIQHVSPIQRLCQSYSHLESVKQSHRYSGAYHRFRFRDGSSFQLNLLLVDIAFLFAILREKASGAEIDITLPHNPFRSTSNVEDRSPHLTLPPQGKRTKYFGFIAMEYDYLILNRTFIIFVTPDALYGWRVRKSVSAYTPYYYERYLDMVEDEALAANLEEIKRVAGLPGGFVLPHSQLKSVEFTPKKKWGMGPVRHSGRLFITSQSDHRREFILLGEVDGSAIQREILPPA